MSFVSINPLNHNKARIWSAKNHPSQVIKVRVAPTWCEIHGEDDEHLMLLKMKFA